MRVPAYTQPHAAGAVALGSERLQHSKEANQLEHTPAPSELTEAQACNWIVLDGLLGSCLCCWAIR